MRKHNPNNERIKHKYFTWLREAKRQSEASVDAAAAAISRFEADTKCRDFAKFHVQQVVAFKARLAAQTNAKTGEPLSKSTLSTVLAHLQRFFLWLADQPGYRSMIRYADAAYFNLQAKEARMAMATKPKKWPTIDQLKRTLSAMPAEDDIQKRNRAMFAFTMLTGARDNAIASLKLKHIDLNEGSVFQDGREVRTKFSKTFTTFFVPVGPEARQVFDEWVRHLRDELFWGDDDPLFPKTRIVVNGSNRFEANGLERAHWANAGPIREIFRTAFECANLPYFKPHSFRDTLAKLGMSLCRSPEALKAWSQNLGHDDVLTTLTSYGALDLGKQQEIIAGLGSPTEKFDGSLTAREAAVLELIRGGIGPSNI